MNNVLDWLQSVDLSSFGEKFLTLVDASDPCFIALILGVLTMLGSRMSAPYPTLRSWGLRVGVAVFLGYVGYVHFAVEAVAPENWVAVGVRGVIAAGLIVAPLWIVCPVLLFVYTRLRLAIAAFLVYAAYVWFQQGVPAEEELPYLAIEAGVASGLTLVIAWILQPITDFVSAHFLPAPRPDAGPISTPARPQLPAVAPREPEPVAGVLEEVRRLLDARNATPPRPNQAEAQAEKVRRRQKARLKAELCYTLHEPAIGHAFPRVMFEEFLSRYLGEHQDAEAAEQNAAELESILRHYVSTSQPPITVQPLDIGDLTQWLVEEQHKIEQEDADQGAKRTKLAGLTRRYTQLAEQILGEAG